MRHIFIRILVFVIILLHIYAIYRVEVQDCLICQYRRCPSSFILSHCDTMQKQEDNSYREFVLNTIDRLSEVDELTKLSIYSNIYGDTMGKCISQTRELCKRSVCKKSCGIKHQEENGLVSKTPTFIQTYSMANFTVNDVYFDDCFMKSNFSEIYTRCHISLFREQCIQKRFNEIKNKCKGE